MTKILALVLAFFALTACEKRPSGATADDARRGSGQALQAARDFTVEQMESYQRDAEARVDMWGDKIESLGTRAEASAAYAKAEVRERISELREKRTAAQLKLEELKTSTGRAWADLRAGMDEALQDLENAYASAASRFQ